MYKHILIPTDGSELSVKAIKQGIGFAKEMSTCRSKSRHDQPVFACDVVSLSFYSPGRRRAIHYVRLFDGQRQPMHGSAPVAFSERGISLCSLDQRTIEPADNDSIDVCIVSFDFFDKQLS